MNLDNCFEMLSTSIINSSTFFGSIIFNLSQIRNKLLTSPLEPFAMYKKTNKLFVRL